MKLTKTQREEIRMKYGGRCAYCGRELEKRFHVDHLKPVRRNYEYVRDGNGRIVYNESSPLKRFAGYINEERNTLDNMMPSCPSCNIIKNSLPLESFRRTISNFITSLNRDSTQYKFAKRYGLVQETQIEVKFYFEEYETNP